VIHYDSEGLSRRCFEVLQKRRLSAHFLLDLDGTIYQTLDLRERAYHATIANSRSIGIEIANIGALGPDERAKFAEWYQRDPDGTLRVVPPARLEEPGIRAADFIALPARPDLVNGIINGRQLEQYDFTPEQYTALVRLTAALHRLFPRMALDCPRDAQGQVIAGKLSPTEFEHFRGLIGHFHIQANKVDPGPAFQWDAVLDGAWALLATPPGDSSALQEPTPPPAPTAE
jgi:N-acetyl-anhydromuramyl-L-alanine amidase AmpD